MLADNGINKYSWNKKRIIKVPLAVRRKSSSVEFFRSLAVHAFGIVTELRRWNRVYLSKNGEITVSDGRIVIEREHRN